MTRCDAVPLRSLHLPVLEENLWGSVIFTVLHVTKQSLYPWPGLCSPTDGWDVWWKRHIAVLSAAVWRQYIILSVNIISLYSSFIRSTPLNNRPNNVGLKCPSVRPSTKSFFDFNKIWYVGRGRWVMHDGMQHDPIQGQGQGYGHEPIKVGNSAIFKGYFLTHL